jgi:toxin-antitoxin system PIN domain toxin
MILVDANLLLYAYDSAAPEHAKARRWLEEVLAKPEPVLFPWNSVHAFLRIASNPRAWKSPLTIQEAQAIVDEWLSLPNVVTPSPGERHWEILRELLADSQCHGPLVSDAVLAALAMEHGAELCTNDRDFSRFPKLRVLNPLNQP